MVWAWDLEPTRCSTCLGVKPRAGAPERGVRIRPDTLGEGDTGTWCLSGIEPPSLAAHVAKEASRSLGHLGGFSLRRNILNLGSKHPQRRAEAPTLQDPGQ